MLLHDALPTSEAIKIRMLTLIPDTTPSPTATAGPCVVHLAHNEQRRLKEGVRRSYVCVRVRVHCFILALGLPMTE